MRELTQHPLSATFPPMSEPDFAVLAADIASNGLRSAVVIHGGQVLDGWHRYRACSVAGVEPLSVEFDGADPVAFVLSMNLSRRHLTPSQRAAAVLECSQWRGLGACSAPVRTQTTAQLAKLADVSTRTIENAKSAIRKGKLSDLKSGTVTAKKAAVDHPDAKEREPYDPREEAYEFAAEAMTIIEADDRLKAAMAEVTKAKRETKTISALYDSLKSEVAAHQRQASHWMRKAKRSALCAACKASLETASA